MKKWLECRYTGWLSMGRETTRDIYISRRRVPPAELCSICVPIQWLGSWQFPYKGLISIWICVCNSVALWTATHLERTYPYTIEPCASNTACCFSHLFYKSSSSWLFQNYWTVTAVCNPIAGFLRHSHHIFCLYFGLGITGMTHNLSHWTYMGCKM